MILGTRAKIHISEPLETFVSNAASVHGYLFNCKVKEFRLNKRKFESINSGYADFLLLKDENYEYILDSSGQPQQLDWVKNIPSQIFRNAVTDFRSAVDRYKKGLGSQPVYKKRNEKNTVYITNEIFYITHVKKTKVIENFVEKELITSYRVHLKTGARQKRQQYETFEVNHGKHGIEKLPNSFRIKKIRNEYFFTASYNDLVEVKTQEELLKEFSYMSYEDLQKITVGIDRGITHIISCDGVFFDVDPEVVKRLIRKAIGRKKHERKLARQKQTNMNGGKAFKKGEKKPPLKKGDKVVYTENMKKTQAKISDCYEYQTNCRKDQAHKISKEVVEYAEEHGIQIIAFEDLKLKNMMKRPKAKMVNGKYVRNGAKAKSGLNRSLAGANLGFTKLCITYKAARKNKLVVVVPPQYTSQRCDPCGHISKHNRKSQAVFICEACGHVANADHNADSNVKHVACLKLSEGSLTFKKKKKAAARKKVNGGMSGCPPKGEKPDNACGETVRLIRDSVNEFANMQGSEKQESCIGL